MDRSLHDPRRAKRRAARTMTGRFSGFEVLMFTLLGIALVDCVGLAWLIIHGLN